MNKIEEMLKLQLKLNNDTNGEQWVTGITKNDKTINWRRCIYMECAELIDSFSWKHWKSIHQAPDFDNIKVEVVDIWHFVMSLMIENNQNITTLTSEVEELLKDSNLIVEAEIKEFETYMGEVETLMLLSLDKTQPVQLLLKQYLKTLFLSGLSIDSLYELYLGKNVLNSFRQDNGYKEGTYQKEWNGVEDNVHMLEVLRTQENATYESVYQALESIYKQL